MAGLILALINMRRHQLASLLALLGCGLALFTTLAQISFQFSMLDQPKGSSYYSLMVISVYIAAIFRAIAGGLIIAAIFVPRSPSKDRSRDEDSLPPLPRRRDDDRLQPY